MIKRISVVFTLTVFLAGLSHGQPLIEGEWDATVTFQGGTASGVMRLEADGQTLTGTSDDVV